MRLSHFPSYHGESVNFFQACAGYPKLPAQAGIKLSVTHQNIVGLQQYKKKVVGKIMKNIFNEL